MSWRKAQAEARLRAEGYSMAWYLVSASEPVRVRYDTAPDGSCKARVYRVGRPADPLADELVGIGFRAATVPAVTS